MICRTAPEERPETRIGSDRKKRDDNESHGKLFPVFRYKIGLAEEMVETSNN